MKDLDKKKPAELYRLRINDKTVILVPKEKCNEEYANKVRARMSKSGGAVSMKYIDYWCENFMNSEKVCIFATALAAFLQTFSGLGAVKIRFS